MRQTHCQEAPHTGMHRKLEYVHTQKNRQLHAHDQTGDRTTKQLGMWDLFADVIFKRKLNTM